MKKMMLLALASLVSSVALAQQIPQQSQAIAVDQPMPPAVAGRVSLDPAAQAPVPSAKAKSAGKKTRADKSAKPGQKASKSKAASGKSAAKSKPSNKTAKKAANKANNKSQAKSNGKAGSKSAAKAKAAH